MAHHKKGRVRRNRRAGCKMCKPWKICGYDKNAQASQSHSDYRRRYTANEAVREYVCDAGC